MTGVQTVLIVEARFYEDIADELVAGAGAGLEAAGMAVERVAVPGAFEIPAAIAMAESGQQSFAGYVALGCVIRGETTHYEYVCAESARGLQDLAARQHLAIGYGILTTENRMQAWMRADRSQGNKGAAAADACLRMMDLRQRFGDAS